jgi:nicotinate dehydrogenase subunit B
MKEELTREVFPEPERYELTAGPAYHFEPTRRQLLQLLGGGIIVFLFEDTLAAQEPGRGRRPGAGREMPQEISAWLHVGEDGGATVFTGKVEIGQNIRTSLTQVVAEELRVSPEAIRMVMGDTDLTPYDRGTSGSRTTPDMAPQLRKVAAAAREVLIELAAEKWKVDRSSLVADDGKVTHAETHRSVGYGQLSGGKEITKAISDSAPTTPATEWKVCGKSLPKVQGREMVTGKHKFPSDIKLPAMLRGKVLRPPAFGARLVSVDLTEAQAIAGVTAVHDGDFVGVAAPGEPTAERALAAIHAEWKTTPQISAAELFEYLKTHAAEGGGRRSSPHVVGSMEQGLAAADKKLEQTYTIAYIAHTPLEPRAAVAQWKDDKLTVWTGTQHPFGVHSALAGAFGIPEERVRVLMPDMGSGYGGKHTSETAIEAARLARATGRPVKVVWTREEEFTWAYFRPAGVIEVRSGARNDGTLVAWEFHNYNSGGAGIRTMYDVPNQHIEFHPVDSPLRQGSYRALAATANHFARESHMDELAHALGMDALEFRLKNLKDPRLRTALETAAQKFGWGKTKPAAGHGFGLACGLEKGGYIAACAEVAVDRSSGEVKIVRVTQAFECGAILNPRHLENQIEGGIVMAIGGAMFEKIDFQNGKILNARLSRYRVPRFSDLPRIETVLIDRKDLPSAGAGETPLVGLAPSVGNAIFNATGVRLRSLPMVPDGLKV